MLTEDQLHGLVAALELALAEVEDTARWLAEPGTEVDPRFTAHLTRVIDTLGQALIIIQQAR